jgi:hypothetical protein
MLNDLSSDVLLELHVPDFSKAKEFYGSIGFEVVWEKPESEKLGGYLVLRKDKSIINFYGGSDSVYSHSYFNKFDSNTPRGYGVEIIVLIKGIEDFFSQFVEIHKDKVVSPLQHKHSRKDFRAVDPFGYYLRFVERYNWVDGRDKKGNPIN